MSSVDDDNELSVADWVDGPGTGVSISFGSGIERLRRISLFLCFERTSESSCVVIAFGVL